MGNLIMEMMCYLHGDWEVVLGLWREKDVDCLLLEGGVTCGRGSNLDNVKLATLSAPHPETEQGGVSCVPIHPELEQTNGSLF